jgi:hypothetical protein
MILAYINPGIALMVGALWLGVWLGWTAWTTRWKAAPQAAAWRQARMLMTAGLVLLAIHAFIALDNFHNWSHEMARIAMELRTAEFLPWSTGAVIYLTYAYLALWTMEAAWSWLAFSSWQSRPKWLDVCLQAFLQVYGLGLILFLGGLAAHYVPPPIPGMLVALAVAVATWLWRRAQKRD